MENHTIITGTICVFVDDMLCLGFSSYTIKWFQSVLLEKFPPIQSDVDLFITCKRSSNCISLPQLGYIFTLMSRFIVDKSSSATYPTFPMP